MIMSKKSLFGPLLYGPIFTLYQSDLRPLSAGHPATLSPFLGPKPCNSTLPLRLKKMPFFLVLSKNYLRLRRRNDLYLRLFSFFSAVLRNNFSRNWAKKFHPIYPNFHFLCMISRTWDKNTAWNIPPLKVQHRVFIIGFERNRKFLWILFAPGFGFSRSLKDFPFWRIPDLNHMKIVRCKFSFRWKSGIRIRVAIYLESL